MPRRAPLILLACLLVPGAAMAQALRSMVIPGDSVVAIAPRGQVAPPPAPLIAAPPPAPVTPLAATPLAPAAGLGAVPLAPAMGVLLPLAAAALLGGALPGSGGGTSAPASTR